MTYDIEEVAKLAAHPRPGVILIRDRIDTKLGDELLHLFRLPGFSDMKERLCEGIRSAPDGNVERSRIVAIRCVDEQPSAWRKFLFAHR
jgi:hypothetical protein